MLGPLIFRKEQIEGIYENAFFTSAALTISTFIYGRTPGGVSLVDGLIVTVITNVITIGASINFLTIISANDKPKIALKIATILHLTTCLSYGLLVWTKVDSYATTPECNLNSTVKFVLFGHSVGATSRGLRGFSIFSLSILAISIPVVLSMLVVPSKTFSTIMSEWRGSKSDSDSESGGINFEFFSVVGVASWVYGVVTIEQIIQRNGVTDATAQWTFGQTFALVLVLGPVIEFFATLVEKNFK